MRPLMNEERKLMRHALGLDTGSLVYRNAYITAGRHHVWEGLCACGAANRSSFTGEKQWTYWVTREGCQAVLEPGEHHDGETSFDHAN